MKLYKCLNCSQTSSVSEHASFTFLCNFCGSKMVLLNPFNIESNPFTHIEPDKTITIINEAGIKIQYDKKGVELLYKNREYLGNRVEELKEENDKFERQNILYEEITENLKEKTENLKENVQDLSKRLTKAQSNICVLNSRDDKLYFENKKLKEVIELYKTIIEKLGD